MSEPGRTAIEWRSVLSSAHRRLAARLGVLAAVGGVGAVLLLGGGVATRGAVHDDGTEPLGPPRADLVIASIESGTIRVENAGDADAAAFEVLARIDEEEVSVEPAGLEGLAAGESADLRFECREGHVTVEVRGQAADRAELEDERSEPISCEGAGELPKLTIAVKGQTAFITNDGAGVAGEFSVTASDSDGVPVPAEPSSVNELAPGESLPVRLECKEGSTVRVRVEPLEGSAANEAEGSGTCGEVPENPSDGGAVDEPDGSLSGADGDSQKEGQVGEGEGEGEGVP